MTVSASSETPPLTATQTENQLKPVFDHYFDLKDALVKTDANSAVTNSQFLVASIAAVKMGNLKKEEHTVWMKVMKQLNADAKSIAETKDIKKQRAAFTGLSKNIHDLMKASKLAAPVYYQYCPMANNGEGANWLSREKAIKNPYFGSKMMSCGSVTETLK